MFRFFIFIFLIFTTSSNSGEISSKVSEYVSNLIPGEGDTEVSIDLRENNKPDYSILAVREIQKTEDGNFFTQFSFFNTEKNNDERLVGNLGFGKRILSDDKTMMTGFNAFIDYDDIGNARSSFGLEARNAVLDFGYNYYFGIDDGTDEKVLDGYDFRLASQIPHMHWADIFINAYEWEGRDRDCLLQRQRFRPAPRLLPVTRRAHLGLSTRANSRFLRFLCSIKNLFYLDLNIDTKTLVVKSWCRDPAASQMILSASSDAIETLGVTIVVTVVAIALLVAVLAV